MKITRKALPRRTILRGMGAAVGLPFLDAMLPAMATPAQAAVAKTPLRLAFAYVPNGIIMNHWNPSYEGQLGELPRILKAMEPHRDDILMLGNLTHNTGRALLDGAGDHGRCSGSYLTGIQVKKTMVDIKAGVSCDQIVAKHLGEQTRFPSLEVGMEDARQAGDCDSGYSCAYTNNLAWKSETQPLPPLLDPRAMFERLFGNGAVRSPEAKARQADYRRSILDFVNAETGKLKSALGPSDNRKLDEYLTSIREVERQIDRAEKTNAQIDPKMEKPYGVPADFSEHFKLMTDMITIAFQADLTRVVTFLMTREGTSRPYRELDIADGHHPCTHHMNKPDLIEKVVRINTYHVAQMANWVEKLKTTKESTGSLLDNMMLVYGAGLSDGNRHLHEDLPTILIGKGGNTIKPGRRVVFRRETPMCNMHLALMERMGVHMEHFGDATGQLNLAELS